MNNISVTKAIEIQEALEKLDLTNVNVLIEINDGKVEVGVEYFDEDLY